MDIEITCKNCAKQHIWLLYINFGGDFFFVFCLLPSVAQLSSTFHYLSCFPATPDIIIDVDELNDVCKFQLPD